MWFLRKITSNTNESLCHVKYKGHSTPKRIWERQNGAKSCYSYCQRKLIGWGAAICTHELWEKRKQKATIRSINGSSFAGGRPSAHVTHQRRNGTKICYSYCKQKLVGWGAPICTHEWSDETSHDRPLVLQRFSHVLQIVSRINLKKSCILEKFCTNMQIVEF